jgi:hypothetical protein
VAGTHLEVPDECVHPSLPPRHIWVLQGSHHDGSVLTRGLAGALGRDKERNNNNAMGSQVQVGMRNERCPVYRHATSIMHSSQQTSIKLAQPQQHWGSCLSPAANTGAQTHSCARS